MNTVSKVYKGIIGGLVLLLVFLLAGPAGADVTKATNHKILENYGKLPLSFEANQGQSDAQVKFLSRGRRHTLFLTSTDAVLVLNKSEQSGNGKPEEKEKVTQTVLRMTLIGANPKPSVAGLEELPGKVNYFNGNDPKKWHTNVPTYPKVNYKDVYPGIDLIYYGNQSRLEYDFVVAPGADPKAIKLAFEGTEKIEVDAQGDLILQTAGGQIKMHKPLAYQVVNGVRKEISGSYVLNSKSATKNPKSRSVSFQVATYDRSRPLVIDPVLSYSTYLGGSADDQAIAIAVDAAGNAYVAGETSSANFPTTSGVFQSTFPGGRSDAFVTKMNPTGTALVYSTYLGGSDTSFGDGANGVAVDSGGNAYVTGVTNSTNFPVTLGAFQTTFGGGGFTGCCRPGDAFVTKLNPTGSALVYSTYLGGSGWDIGLSIAVDALGSAYVAGQTHSINFPVTPGAFQTTFRGSYGCGGNTNSGFVTKLNPSGTGLVYSTYLGGGGFDLALGIAVDGAGNAYATGLTSSFDFPVTPGAFQTSNGGGSCSVDAFVTKLNPTGGGVYSTYLGGSGNDQGNGIAVDTSGNAYVAGQSSSTNFPTTPGAFQLTNGGGTDAFLTKLNPSGNGLVYSTFLGGSGEDVGQAIALDSSGNAHVTGRTSSTNFPVANPLQATLAGSFDAFVAKVNPTGSGLIFSSYLGGTGSDGGAAIAVDASGSMYVAGSTASTNFPTTPGAFQTTFGGPNVDGFVAKIATATTVLHVTIDIKPGSFPNSINPKSRGTIPVAILSTTGFNAPAQVDQGSLTFGRTGNEMSLAFCHSEDVNGDGLLDLVCHFDTQAAAFQLGDTQGILKGKTVSGTPLTGSDSVRIVPSK